MDQYRRDWEPAGWHLLVIGPTATWRQDWAEWEAIRDIVQNALDETEAYTWAFDAEGLLIRDDGRGLAVADFLLGPPRLKPPHARGKFGEGMKIAALALIRLGYAVKVDTVGQELWLVFLEVKVDTMAEQLAALWRPNGRTRGTVFHIIGYFGDAFADRFAVNIPSTDILHQGPSTLARPIRRLNQLIAAPPGRVYARDIYLQSIDSPYSYNLWSFEMAPDRHGPESEAEMWEDMGRLWATVNRVELLERFLGMVVLPFQEERDESRRVTMDYWKLGTEPVSGKAYTDIMVENAEAWREAWRRKVGANTVLRTAERLDGTVRHLGYEPVSAHWGVEAVLGMVVKTDIGLVNESQERLREVQVVPDEQLTPRQLAHLRLARAIAERFRFPPSPEVHAAIIPPASDRMRTAGLYGKTTQEVFIGTDQLEWARSTVNTVVHEIAHHTSQAEDGEPAHNAAMTDVAARVVEAVAGRLLDEELKEAVW